MVFTWVRFGEVRVSSGMFFLSSYTSFLSQSISHIVCEVPQHVLLGENIRPLTQERPDTKPQCIASSEIGLQLIWIRFTGMWIRPFIRSDSVDRKSLAWWFNSIWFNNRLLLHYIWLKCRLIEYSWLLVYQSPQGFVEYIWRILFI